MKSTPMFVNNEKKAAMRRWHRTFRDRLPVPTESVTLETPFGTTHALVGGAEAGPPLVLVHGAMASSAHAMGELGPLLRTRRVYALDVIGQSPMSEDRRIEVRDDSYGRWVASATEALGLDTFDLYGVSWGGFVALQAARVIPERLCHLVLMVPAGVVGESPVKSLREIGWPMLMYLRFPSEARLSRVVGALFTQPDPTWTAYFGEALLAYRLDMRIPPLARPEQLADLRCQTLVIGAEQDVHFPGRRLIDRVRKLIPHAEGELLPGSRHCPPFDSAFQDRMAERIERFLGEGTAGAGREAGSPGVGEISKATRRG